MAEKYLMGIDGGSQSTKLQIFDLKGNIVCEAAHPLRGCVSPKAGYSEHPDDDLWASFTAACQKLLAAFEGDPHDILAAGLCTIRSCRVFLKEDGSLAQPVMSWLDSRAFGPIPMQGDARYVTTTTGYFTHRLTGNFSDTVANNSKGQWPVDLHSWDWAQEQGEYDRWNISRESLVSLKLPGDILGHLTPEASRATGLPEGLAIVATANDKSEEALGSGLLDGKTGLISLGTYITGLVNGTQVLDRGDSYFCNFSSVPNQYLYECNGIWRGMWTVSWFVDLLGDAVRQEAQRLGTSPENVLNREAEGIPAGSEGLMVVPEWLNPDFLAHKKGMMIGFDVRHTRAHMFRAILEGIAMTMKNKFTAMCGALDLHPEKMILSGGGSNSDVFAQIFADVFGLPVVRNRMTGAAGLGAAICAAVAMGVYPSFEEAVQAMVAVRDIHRPNEKNHKLYTRINREVFSRLSAQNDALLQALRAILSEA